MDGYICLQHLEFAAELDNFTCAKRKENNNSIPKQSQNKTCTV